MAKKKKKQNSINKKVKSLFDGDVFENGVAKLDDEVLFKLYRFIFDEQKETPTREFAIRSIRRIWSQSNYSIRVGIVDFLRQFKESSIKSKSKNRAKVAEILESFELDESEKIELLHIFENTPSHKLTESKISSKLEYIRFKETIERLKSVEQFDFNSINELEFSNSFEITLCGENFHKLLLVKTQSIDIKSTLKSLSFDEVLERIRELKKDAISRKELEIKKWLKRAESHRYLTKDEFCRYFKSMPPESKFEYIPIGFRTLKRIIKEELVGVELLDNSEQIIVERDEKIEVFGRGFEYRVSLNYKKETLYSLIWQEESLPISKDYHSLKQIRVSGFELALISLKERMEQISESFDLDSNFIESFILKNIVDSVDSRLILKEKSIKRVLYLFNEYLRPLKEKKMREKLLAKSIRDFKLLFPLARRLNRKIVFNVGPTNSGKTFQAMRRLKSATSGYYLAPLRLLALEGYEALKSSNIPVSLITGEEEIIDEESTHISSTVEMLNLDVEVDVCVIDEIQMIGDRDRGWAWVNALIGAPAYEVILTGSEDALSVIKEVCNYLGEELEVVEFERKNPLIIAKSPTPLHKIEPGSAVVTFSRKDVLALSQKLSKEHRVSVIYGNLSPEVRREEARRFREGESSVLVATDAIAMGLNLPIKNIIFARADKFDGVKRRELEPTEVIQIAGRAGRFGFHESGLISALDKQTLNRVSKKFYSEIKQIELPLSVMATLEHILLIGDILESSSLFEILSFFSKNMEFEGPFVARNIDSMVEKAKIVDEYPLELKDKYIFASAPVGFHSSYIESIFFRYLDRFSRGKKVKFKPLKDLPDFAFTQDELLEKEDRVKEISLYLWLSFKYPETFTDAELARESRYRLNSFIENTLKRGKLSKKCRVCKRRLEVGYEFNICQRCYKKQRFG